MLRRIVFLALAMVLVLPIAAAPRPAFAGEPSAGHIVQPGETLYSIARQYGVDPDAIAAANGLLNPDVLFVGQSLQIPGAVMTYGYGHPSEHVIPPSYGGEPGPVAAYGGPSEAMGGGSTYVVQLGDTLYSLADRFGTTVEALLAANGLSDPNMIFAGQTLAIPGGYGHAPGGGWPGVDGYGDGHPGYGGGYDKPMVMPGPGCGYYITVEYGDSLSGIAWNHSVSVYDLAAANGLPYPYMIFAGQPLFVPCASGYAMDIGYPSYAPAAPSYRHHYDHHHGQPKPSEPALSTAACAREVQIVRPLEGQHVSGVVQVIGTAVIPDFQFYKVEWAQGHTPLDFSFHSIASVYTTPVSDTVLSTWYVGNLAKGPYTLRLTAVDNRGQFPTPCNVHVTVD